MCTISRFNIPSKTAIKLFHTNMSPIALYNVENWVTLPDRKLKDYCTSDISRTYIILKSMSYTENS